MTIDFSSFNWLAIGASFIAGQIISTVWFVVLFGEPWAREYGAADQKQHTKEVPGYTDAVGAVCNLLLVLTIATLQNALGITGLGGALALGVLLSVGLCTATIVPGQAFLKRWRVAAICAGSQVAMILGISTILGVWH